MKTKNALNLRPARCRRGERILQIADTANNEQNVGDVDDPVEGIATGTHQVRPRLDRRPGTVPNRVDQSQNVSRKTSLTIRRWPVRRQCVQHGTNTYTY